MTAHSHAPGCGAGDSQRPTVDAHLEEVRALLAPVIERLSAEDPEYLDIDDPDLAGRATAAPLHAPHPLPPFDNSQMDGYAVRAADLAGASPERPVALGLGRATAAGDPPVSHLPGTASPVMTGAAIPSGADAVVPIEASLPPAFPPLSRAGNPEPSGTVSFVARVEPGTFVRATGVDVADGTELLPAGASLGPARIGLLAAAGIARVPVRRRVRILLCSTGDELAERAGSDPHGGPAAALAPGRIHDANTPMLAAAMRAAGAEVRTLRAPDSPELLGSAIERAAIESAAGSADLVVTSGGISAGAFEVVRETFAPLGARFRGIAMQPGGPQGLGVLDFGDTRIAALCFPGNPVSAIISAEVFLLPLLRAAAGLPSDRRRERLALAHAVVSPADKHQVRRGRIEADGRVSLSAPGSHLLGDLAEADVLAHLPIGVEALPEGAEIDVWRLDD